MNTYSASPTETDSSIRICAPGDIIVWRNAPTTAVLSWDEPYAACALCPDAVGYEVSGEGIVTANMTRPPYEVTGLKADAEYLLFVRAKAAGNNVSTASPVRVFTYRLLAPSKPGVPELSQLTSSSVTLNWAPSIDHAGAPRYRVYLNDFLIGQTDLPTFNLMHLRSSVTYRVDVRAVNAAGLSEPATVTFKTALRAPTNLKLKHNAGTCRLSWDPMFLQSPTHEVTINGKPFTVGALGFNFNLAQLSPGREPHHFDIEIYARLDGAISETTKFKTTLDDLEPPTKPGKPVARNVTDSSVDLTWAPASDNTGVVGYRVFRNGFLLGYTANTYYSFVSLPSGSYQCVYVRAEDKAGNRSLASDRTLFRMTGPVSSFFPSPVASVKPLSSTTALLEWAHAPDAVAPAGVMIMKDGNHLETSLIATSAVLRNLVPGFEYVIEVFAFNAIGTLSEPTTLTFEAKDIEAPSTPADVHLLNSTTHSFTLNWKASSDDIDVLEYVIYNNNEYFDRTPLNHYTVVDVLPGVYSFEICAMDLSGNTSAPASIVVEVGDVLCSAPTNFRFTQPGLVPVLQWDTPTDMPNVIRYGIVLTGPLGTDLPYQTEQKVLRPVLLPRTRYKVSITAFNADGASLPLISEFTTK